jgi:hypothetical protein
MEKIISFSLYGNLPTYINGAINNLNLIPIIYGNDWKVRFYIRDVIKETIDLLKEFNCEIIDMNNSDIKNSMMECFTAIKKNNIVLIRDCNNIVTYREKMMVDQFINSKKRNSISYLRFFSNFLLFYKTLYYLVLFLIINELMLLYLIVYILV